MTIQIKSATNTMSVRTNHDTTATKINSVPAGQLMEGEQDWVASQADVDSNTLLNDRWLLVTKANGVALPTPGWVAIVHMGQVYCSVISEGTTTPPPSTGDIVRIIESKVTYESSDGSIKTTTLYPEL